MKDSIAEKMLSLKSEATKTQKILIDYLISTSSEQIIYMSITELSENSGVGEATILRFCRVLGFKGYQDFKLSLAHGVRENKENTQENFLSEIGDNMVKALEESKSKIHIDDVNKAVEIIRKSKNITIFGSGNSAIPAEELHARLLKMGIISIVEVSSHLENIVVSNFDENDCLILFSISGCSKDGVELIELAKSRNVKIIVISSYSSSPIAKLADVLLLSEKSESPMEGGSMVSKVCQLYVVDVISTGIFLKDKDTYRNKIDNSNHSLVKKLY